MFVVNEPTLNTAKICVLLNYVSSRAELGKYANKMKQHGIPLNEVVFISLSDKPCPKWSIGDLRSALVELEDILKISCVNVVVDMTSSRTDTKYERGIVFKQIFHRDNSLWKHRGVLSAEIGSYKGKFICGDRWESVLREKDTNTIVDSEFNVNPEKVIIEIPKTEEETKKAFKELFKCDYFAFDTEASGLKPFAKDFLLYTLQFTSNLEKNKSYIFMYEHPKVKVDNIVKEAIGKGTKWLLHNRKVWVHNFSYDGLVCKRKFDIDFHKVDIYDSMIIYHMLTNTYTPVPLGLKDICFTRGIFYDWDNDLDVFKDEYCKSNGIKKEEFKYEYFDLDELITYGAYDTVALMYLVDELEKMSKEHVALDVIRETWEKHWKSIMQSLYVTMYNGLPFDMEGAKKLQKKNRDRVNEINTLIENNPFVKNAERVLQKEALAKAMKQYNDKVLKAENNGKVFKGKEPNIENGKYGSIDLCPKFKTTSTAHKKVLFIDVLKMKVLEKTDTGNPKLSDEIIQKYAKERPDIDILCLFSEKAKLLKSLSTYIEPWIELVENDIDGRLRSTFNPLNTSGRLRGSSPNLLNITKGAGLKELIKSDTENGWVLGQIDVSALEERSALLLHKDKVKLNMKESGVEDLHSLGAITISKAKKDGILEHLDQTIPDHLKIVKKDFSNLRQNAKALTFGIAFLCSWRSIAYTYNVPEPIAKNILNEYWNTFKGEWDFIKSKVKLYATQGWDIVHGNFPILTPNITEDMEDNDNMAKIRPSYNATHQSSAFTVLRALDKATRRFKEEGTPCKLFLSVYDSIIYEGHIDHIAYASNVLYEYMSEPFIEEQLFPLAHEVEIGVDYSAEFILSRDTEEQKIQLKEFKDKHNIGIKEKQ